ncbi:cytochrome P450 [Lactifluus volemus]|nr:cytochrome P450 [Lactifluus volemus]
MTLFPDAQHKAQHEIDHVVGNDRLPNLADRDSLPYVNALVSEVLRWRPVVPIGVAHKTTDDHVLRGYYIPKGSIVIPNAWKMLHDPAVYADPDHFYPDRFIPRDDKIAERNPRSCLFGFGRRICAGQQFADTTVWLAIATSLAVFRISKVVENGVEITPEGKYTPTLISHPEKFRCNIKARSASAEQLVLHS